MLGMLDCTVDQVEVDDALRLVLCFFPLEVAQLPVLQYEVPSLWEIKPEERHLPANQPEVWGISCRGSLRSIGF